MTPDEVYALDDDLLQAFVRLIEREAAEAKRASKR